MRRKILLSLVLCCAFLPNTHTIPSRERMASFVVQGLSPRTRDQIFSCNKWLAAVKGVDSGAESLRIMCMESKDKKKIQAAAIATALTSALVIGTKLFSAYKQKWVYDFDPLLYLYPALSIGRNVWDLVKAYKIAKNADLVALNNKKKQDDGADSKTTIPLCLLAAETALTLATHHNIHGNKPQIDQLIARVPLGRNVEPLVNELLESQFSALLTKGLSFMLWAARQAYEARNLTSTEQFVTGLEEFENDDEDESSEALAEEDEDLEEWT